MSLLQDVAEGAGLPRHCFIVTEMHGVETKAAEGGADQMMYRDLDLLSDLPVLMAMYETGMELTSITALLDAGEVPFFEGL